MTCQSGKFPALCLSIISAYFRAYLLTFFLAYLLTFILAYLVTFFLTFFFAYLLQIVFLSYLLTFFLAYLFTFLLTFSLAFFLAYYLAHLLTRGWGPAGKAAVRNWRLRSSQGHCRPELAVEVFLTFFLAHLLTLFLAYIFWHVSVVSSGTPSGISFDILSDIRSCISLHFFWHAFWRCIWHIFSLAVEVRCGTLPSGAGGWGPAAATWLFPLASIRCFPLSIQPTCPSGNAHWIPSNPAIQTRRRVARERDFK